MIRILILLTLIIFPLSVMAQDTTETIPTSLTRIEVNETEHQISFIINGQVKAVLDEDGLKVSGDVEANSFLHGQDVVLSATPKEGAE
jgi:hypothetical protein